MSVTSSGLLETVTGQVSHQLFHILPLVPETTFPLMLPGAEVLKLECALESLGGLAADPDSGARWGREGELCFCVSNQFPGDAEAARPGTRL